MPATRGSGRRSRPHRAPRTAAVGQAVRRPVTRATVSLRVATVTASAAAVPTAPATLGVPLRRPRSCPPPSILGRTRAPARTTSAPLPFGPPNLCPLIDTNRPARPPRRRRATGWPGRHRCAERRGATPRPRSGPPRRAAGRCRSRCSRPSPTPGPRRGGRHRPGRRGRPGRRARWAPHGVRPRCGRQGPARPQHGVVLHRRAHHGRGRPVGAFGRHGFPPTVDRQVVGLRTSGGEYDLARCCAQQLGQQSRASSRRSAPGGLVSISGHSSVDRRGVARWWCAPAHASDRGSTAADRSGVDAAGHPMWPGL